MYTDCHGTRRYTRTVMIGAGRCTQTATTGTGGCTPTAITGTRGVHGMLWNRMMYTDSYTIGIGRCPWTATADIGRCIQTATASESVHRLLQCLKVYTDHFSKGRYARTAKTCT